MKKLYEVPNETTIGVAHLGLYDTKNNLVETLHFCYVDGMYSLCYHEGKPVHLSATTKVEEL